MRWPTDDPYVSSPFGQRKHPVTGVVTLHAGADFPRPRGGNLYAIQLMTIAGKGTSRTGGNWVSGDMPDGRRAIYFHMAHPSPLPVGREVPEGTVVGVMGETGLYVTGIHLHFEVRRSDVPQDPVPYIRAGIAAGGGGTPLPLPTETEYPEMFIANVRGGSFWLCVAGMKAVLLGAGSDARASGIPILNFPDEWAVTQLKVAWPNVT